MWLKAFIYPLVLLNMIICREISRETLDQLENLLSDYKSLTLKETHQQKQDNSETFDINQYKIEKCAISSRQAYLDCFSVADSKEEKTKCAELFYTAYTGCFFVQQTDLSTCFASCLRAGDRCVIESNKIEEFLCMNARRCCSGKCQNPQQNDVSLVEKRGKKKDKLSVIECKRNCDTDHLLCVRQSESIPQTFLCNVNRPICDGSCKPRRT